MKFNSKLVLVALTLAMVCGAQNMFSESTPVGLTLGYEIDSVTSGDTTASSVGPWFDYYHSFGLLDVETYGQVYDNVATAGNTSFYGEFDAYLNCKVSDSVKLIPAVSFQYYDNALTLEPQLKAAFGNFSLLTVADFGLGESFNHFDFSGIFIRPKFVFGDVSCYLQGYFFQNSAFLNYVKWNVSYSFPAGMGLYTTGKYTLATDAASSSYEQDVGISYSF